MEKTISRRSFLKISGASAVTLAVLQFGFDDDSAYAFSKEIKTANLKPTPTICTYCAVGCGILIYAKGNDVVYSEGDPDHPINEGTLCPKGHNFRELYTSENRSTKPLYRAPGSDKWEEKDWDWMYNEVAKRVKDTRDRTFQDKVDGLSVSRTEAIATMGGAQVNNEEAYLINKLFRGGLGLTYIEHQARI